MQRAAIDDFTVKDLTAPTHNRVKQILSGLINFRLFEQEQAEEYFNPVQEEDDAFETREGALIADNQRLREDMDRFMFVHSRL